MQQAEGLSKQPLDPRDEGGGLDIQRSGELAEGGERRLADATFHLAHEGPVHVRAQSEGFLGNPPRVALFTQDLAEDRGDVFGRHRLWMIRPVVALSPRDMIYYDGTDPMLRRIACHGKNSAGE